MSLNNFLLYLNENEILTISQLQKLLNASDSKKNTLTTTLVQLNHLTHSSLKEYLQELDTSLENPEFSLAATLKSTKNNTEECYQEIERFLSEQNNSDLSKTVEIQMEQIINTPKKTKTVDLMETDGQRYKTLETIGQGGMGVVQRVEDRLLGREVALKKIRFEKTALEKLSSQERILLWRLYQEASITAMLEHPNIVPLYDMQRNEQGELHFTMRKISGDTFQVLLAKKKAKRIKLEENKILAIFLKVCDGVSYAHSKGIVHRDLKPENIMVGEFGEVYIVDWGIAKVLGTKRPPSPELIPLADFQEEELKTVGGTGTFGYFPPEQKTNASSVQPQADIYALGKILKQCFTLHSPLEELKEEKEFEEKANNLPSDIQAIIEKATQEKWENRYSNVQEMILDIERYLKHLKVSVREYSPVELIQKWLKRNRPKVLVFSLILALLFVFFGYLKWFQRQEKQKQFDSFYQKAQKEQQRFQDQDTLSTTEKNYSLLNALHFLNQALRLTPANKKLQQEKLALSENLIKEACQTENYQLANYVTWNLEEENATFSSTKQRLEQYVKKQQFKQLTEHKKRLNYWKKTLMENNLLEGMREKAIFEISKMQEEEIFSALLKLLEEGTQYFLKEPQRNSRHDEFYLTMVKALGRLNKPLAVNPILKALSQMEAKVRNLDPKPLADIDYMVTLAEALWYLNVKETAKPLEEIRQRMGQNRVFWERTKVISSQLFANEKEIKEEIKPKNALEWFKFGMLKKDGGEIEAALNAFDKAIRLDPKFDWAYSVRGLTKLGKGQAKEAILDFNKAIQLNPNYPDAYSNRGLAQEALKDFSKAIADYTKALEIKPTFFEAFNNRGLVAFNQGEFASALTDFTQAIKINPLFDKGFNNRGMVYAQLKKISLALADYNQCLQLNPSNVNAYLNRADLYLRQQNPSQALTDLNKAVALSPNSALAYFKRANLKKDSRDFEGALQDYQQAIQLQPDFSAAYHNRAFVKKRKKDLKGALKDYQQAIFFNPLAFRSYSSSGSIRKNLNDYQGALADFNKAIEINPKYAIAYYNRGNLRTILKDNKGALADFKKAIELNPKFAQAFYNLGFEYQKNNEIDLAISAFEQGFQLNPKLNLFAVKQLTNLIFQRMRLRYKNKEFKKALEDLLRFEKYATPAHPAYKKIEELKKVLQQKVK